MSETYTESLLLRTRDCDQYGAWRPAAILEELQETAATHCTEWDCDYLHLRDIGLAWVISGTHVSLSRVPTIGQTLEVETFIQPLRHFFFPRMHVFRDGEGRVIGGAHSLWVLLDIRERKIVRSEYVESRLPAAKAVPAPTAMPRPLKPLEAPVVEAPIPIGFTSFDINRHANNVHYMDWCLDALGFDRLRDQVVTDFTVQYESEILPGMEVTGQLAERDGQFTYIGHSNGSRLFSIGGALSPREVQA